MGAIAADTTPLNYLILIEAAEILPRLYGNVLIPPAVRDELAHANTPDVVRTWIAQAPSWLRIASLKQPVDPVLLRLDAGEREAISLASELQAELVLIDERDGAMAARQLGLRVTGTLAVLDLAAARGWIDLRAMFNRLRQTTFRAPLRLMASMLEQDAQRIKQK
jgi:predicted nucleic acid-binding protein